jgi:hypothetical protein
MQGRDADIVPSGTQIWHVSSTLTYGTETTEYEKQVTVKRCILEEEWYLKQQDACSGLGGEEGSSLLVYAKYGRLHEEIQ